MAYEEDSIAGLLATPERLAQVARWDAEDVLEECYRRGHTPTHYSLEALRKRAERTVTGDIELEARLGYTYAPAQTHAYREQYVTAFLAAWQDKALRQESAARHARRSYIIVCYR